MSATTTISVEIEPQAAELVAELGMQAEFEQILEYLRQNVDGLINLTVRWGDSYDTGLEPRIVIQGLADRPWEQVYEAEKDMGRWMIETFPPQVWSRFPMILHSPQ